MAIIGRNNQPTTEEVTHVTQEMYKKNLELNERNKTLALLRKIDEVVLSSASDPVKVAQDVVDTIITETDFKLAVIFLQQGEKFEPFVANKSAETSELERAVIELLTQAIAPGRPINDAIKAGEITSKTLYELLENNIQPSEAPKLSKALNLETLFLCPLLVRNRALGCVVIGTSQAEHEMSEYSRNLVDRLAGVIAIALDSSLLYQELQSANEHLKELDKAKDEFISMASHQLRTPLTTIKGYVSMVEEGDTGAINEQQKKFLASAMTGATRMAKMITELLNVSRMSTGKFKIDPKPVDLAKIVQDEVSQLQLHAASRNLKLEFKKPARPITCELDEDKTRQVIMNFIDNGIFYTKQGSVTVTLEQDPNKVTFKVIDTGIGVPEAVKDKMFTKFFRADNAKVARPDGTGLGLYLAKRVIEDQGGQIICESQEGKGSTFGFELPNKVKPADNGSGEQMQ